MLDLESYLRFVLALGVVLGLIGGLAWLLKRYGFERAAKPRKNRVRRLEILETRAIDARHKLVLLARDGIEHLVVLGPGGETVVESGFKAPAQPREEPSFADRHPNTAAFGARLVELYREEPRAGDDAVGKTGRS